VASSDVVKGLERGTIAAKGTNSGDGHKAMSPVQVIEEQRGHSNLNPSATRSFPGELNPQPRRTNRGEQH
jgi:hypothetical protein